MSVSPRSGVPIARTVRDEVVFAGRVPTLNGQEATQRTGHLHTLGRFKGGGTPSKTEEEFWNGDIPWVSPKDMKLDYLSDAQMHISQGAISRSAASLIESGSLLFVVRGMILAHSFPVALARAELTINQDMKALVLHDAQMGEYLLRALKALKPEMLKRVRRSTHGTCRIDGPGYRYFLVPIPPVAEQGRIIAMIDGLMSMCDQLEAARAEREAKRERLTTACFARLNTSDPDATRFADDARFALNILPTLTARREQIQQLRQSILNLAVRGRLVSRDPNDEMPVVPISDDNEAPPAIPSTWVYARLSKLLSEDTRNGYSRKPDHAPNGTPILRISAATIRSDGIVDEQEHKLISGIDPEAHVQYGLRPGDLLACRFNGNKSFVGRLSIFHDELHIEPIYPDKLIRVRVDPRKVEPEFIRLAGETDIVRTKIEAACATTVGNWGISASNLKDVYFPVPPIAEQRRIVARVQELMTLCDRLEANLSSAATTRSRLLEALLADALAPIASGIQVAQWD